MVCLGQEILETGDSLRSESVVTKVEVLNLFTHDCVHHNLKRHWQVFLQATDENVAKVDVLQVGPSLKNVLSNPVACGSSV